MTKLRELNGFEEAITKRNCELCELPYTDCRCDTHNNTIDQISDVNVVVDNEKLALILLNSWNNMHPSNNWPQVLSNSIFLNLKEIIRLEKSDDKQD